MAQEDRLLQQFPDAARFLGGLHQDFDICYTDIGDYAQSFLARSSDARTDASALVEQLRRATMLDQSDLKALWRKSGAEILPRKTKGMRDFLLAAAVSLDGGQ
jgi:hypothetical protein